MDEGTARFGFLGASGLTSLCSAAAFWMAVTERPGPATLFIGLALVGMGAMAWFRRTYVRLRAVRWQDELRASQAALDALLQPTTPAPLPPPPADSGADSPRDPHERT
jgi:hypothetical protein